MSQTSVYKYLCLSFFRPTKARPRQIKIRSMEIQFKRSIMPVHQTDITRFIPTTTTASPSVFFYYSVYFPWERSLNIAQQWDRSRRSGKKESSIENNCSSAWSRKKISHSSDSPKSWEIYSCLPFAVTCTEFRSAAGGKAAHVNRFQWARHDKLKAS